MKTLFFFTVLFIFLQVNLFSQEPVDFTEISESEESGNYSLALLKAKSMLENDSLNSRLWIEVARLYRLNQQYKQSVEAYEQAGKLNPENKTIILFLARAHKLAGNKDLSSLLFKHFLYFEPNNIQALSELGTFFSSSNNFDSAAIIYKKLHLLDTLNVAYLHKLANSQWFTNNQNEAFDNYRKALRLDSFYLPVVYDLSRIYINKKLQDSAISLLQLNIKKSPEESRLYNDLGNAFFTKGFYFEAAAEYEKAIKLGYRNNEVFRRLAISYYSSSQFDKSKEHFEALIRKDTSDYKICMYLGNIYNLEQNPQKGLIFFNRSIELITPDPMTLTAIYTGIAESYKLDRKFEEQITTIKTRQEIIPLQFQSPQYLLEIAEIYDWNLRNKQKALNYYQEYYNAILKSDSFSQEMKSKVKTKINKLKEELHFGK